MDQLLNGMYEVFSKMVPFFICLLIIVLIVLLVRLITFLHDLQFTINSVNGLLNEANHTVKEANKMLEKMEGPCDTIVQVAETIARLDNFSNKMFAEAIHLIIDNISTFIDWLKKLFHKDENTEIKIENNETQEEQ